MGYVTMLLSVTGVPLIFSNSLKALCTVAKIRLTVEKFLFKYELKLKFSLKHKKCYMFIF